MSNDTIYALSSAPGKAAVAVLRVSGPGCQAIATDMAAPTLQPRRAALRTITHPISADAIDQALVLWFPGPNSATGEDLLEFHGHGGRAVTAALMDALATYPSCRLAEPGEFARRGFENGKIDLTEAEGIADLIDAETDVQRRQALRQASGSLGALYEGWRAQAIEAQALLEAAIDFADEADVAADAVERAHEAARRLTVQIAAHVSGARRGEIIRDGFRVVIAGPPNAGKSSLLNVLARRDAAIVSDEAGTTRDIIDIHMDLDGMAVTISDTAGLRDGGGHVEREGIQRALTRAADADLVIWLDSVDDPAAVPEDLQSASPRILQLTNKSDLVDSHKSSNTTRHSQMISVANGRGLEDVLGDIAKAASDAVGLDQQLVPTNHRHLAHLRQTQTHLDTFLAAPDKSVELAAEDMRLAAGALGRLTGRIDVEDVLDQIFLRFCIGK